MAFQPVNAQSKQIQKKAGKRIKTWHLKMVVLKPIQPKKLACVFKFFFLNFKLNSTLLDDFNSQIEIGC